ncbi:MAG: hypothetical protein COV75_03965 [Candidatus Omnitrophica bacterium CG11_big_fil_rev_8_21_14_0_20_63_9]|nr:MAG: hypothetical protein COV75_03965 [Candidatus Omnitrophica bacterium CG11_big_fil_rev_8_21_14_0_20_63_9]
MSRPVLGCILSQFPRYDEAFILRELVALSQGEQDLVIFSLRPCRDRVIHAQAKPLLPRTVYSPFVWSWAVWRSQVHFIRRAPSAYLAALGWVVSRHWRHPVILAKTLVAFPKTAHFARLAQERGVTHLHAFWATYPAAAAVIINRLTGMPYSLSGHAHDLYTTNPTLVEKVHGARFVLTCTEENKRYLEQLSRNGTSVIVGYHGVDLSKFAPAAKPDGSVCYLLAVGSLLPCKGYETLIEACHRLDAQGVPFRCTIAGGGPLEGALRRQIARYHLETHVEITGYVSQERVAALYQQAHMLVLPLVSKIHWGIPNVLIEALATKTPVICCDLPSLKELVEHGRTGWVIPEQDAAALIEAVTALWSDAPLRARLADEGHARVIERFSLERTGAQLRRLFTEAA